MSCTLLRLTGFSQPGVEIFDTIAAKVDSSERGAMTAAHSAWFRRLPVTWRVPMTVAVLMIVRSPP